PPAASRPLVGARASSQIGTDATRLPGVLGLSRTPPHMTAKEIEAVEAKARGSSFYSAMKLMPRAEREAMFAIYAFCRMVDDIADDGIGTRDERFAALNDWRKDLDVLYDGGVPIKSGFLKDAVTRYGLRKQDFLA